MITDRTLQDVENAKILREKIQAGGTLTIDEISQIERGTCSIDMLNRVERKTKELADALNDYLYQNNVETKINWQNDEILTYSDYNRILNNLDILKTAYYTYTTTPQTPKYMYGFEEANDIEKILVDIEDMIYSMVSNFRECGDYECGQD